MSMVLQHIHSNVPKLLLSLAYNPSKEPVSIDKLIQKTTLMGRVYQQCNLVAGKRKEIVLTSSMVVQTEMMSEQEGYLRMGKYAVYEIPPEYRDNRPIVSVIGLGYPNQAISYPWDQLRPSSGATVGKLAKAVLTSHTMSGALITPDVELISGDRVKIDPPQYSDFGWVLSCNIAYDDNFNSLNAQAVIALQELCLCAVKSYIYNELVLEIDQGKIIHGGEVGAIKDLIYEYKSEEEKFKELLGEFNGGAILDMKRKRNLLQSML